MDQKLNNLNQKVNTNNLLAASLIPFLSKTENSVMSPLGIKTVLSMIAEGASEESLDEILSVLGIENLDEARKTIFAMQEDNNNAFSSKNSLNLKSGLENLQLDDDFKQTMKDDYKAGIIEVESDGLAQLELANKVNFDAKWAINFELDQSGENRFQNVDGTKTKPLFLRYKGNRLKFCNGYQDGNRSVRVKAVALPYVNDNKPIPYELVLIDTNMELTEKNLNYISRCAVEIVEKL